MTTILTIDHTMAAVRLLGHKIPVGVMADETVTVNDGRNQFVHHGNDAELRCANGQKYHGHGIWQVDSLVGSITYALDAAKYPSHDGFDVLDAYYNGAAHQWSPHATTNRFEVSGVSPLDVACTSLNAQRLAKKQTR